jgi:hypothetical protein
MRRYNLKLGIVDIIIQGMILFFAVLSALAIFIDTTGIIYLLLLQFFIGLYQICSGIIGAALGRKWKIPYLIGTLVFIIVLVGGSALISEISGGRGDGIVALAIIGGIIVPYTIAIGYFVMSIKTYQEERLENEYSPRTEEFMDESILDEGII